MRPIMRASRAELFVPIAALGLFGCEGTQTLLLPRKSLELVASLQPSARPHARVPAVRERDQSPVLINYKALGWDDNDLAAVRSKRARFYRVQAPARPALYYVGGVTLAMALPHLLLGLGVVLDKAGSGFDVQDRTGAATAIVFGGLHVVAGALMLGLYERRPTLQASDSGVLQPYLDESTPDIPGATMEAPPPSGETKDSKPPDGE
jgi:hypothetical protein